MSYLGLLDPSAASQAIQSVVADIIIPAGLPGHDGTAKLFETVALYETTDMAEAFERLFITKTRVAIVVFESVRYTRTVQGTILEVTAEIDISVMFSDRDWADRLKGMYGSDDKGVIGALRMVNVLATGLIGAAIDGVYVVKPADESGKCFLLTGEARDNQTGRICYRQPFTVYGGTARVGLPRGTRR